MLQTAVPDGEGGAGAAARVALSKPAVLTAVVTEVARAWGPAAGPGVELLNTLLTDTTCGSDVAVWLATNGGAEKLMALVCTDEGAGGKLLGGLLARILPQVLDAGDGPAGIAAR